MSQGSKLTAKWHAARCGEPPEDAKQKEDHSIRGKLKALHEDIYGKPKNKEENRK